MTLQLKTLQAHRSHNVEALEKVKVNGQIVLANAFPKRLDVATSNFTGT